MSSIVIQELRVSIADQEILRGLNLEFSKGEVHAVMGPNGSGKSTLAKVMAGHPDYQVTEGDILLDNVPVKAPAPDRVFVFQEFDQLLPWKTVKENIVFALTASGKAPRRQAEERAMHNIQKVKLTEFANSYPHTLSGGMKQRAAIARALAMEPRILLMDEPFAALDALTRGQMQEELLQLWQETKFSVLFVTHSISEAIQIGTRILVLSAHPGQVKAELNSGFDEASLQELLFDA